MRALFVLLLLGAPGAGQDGFRDAKRAFEEGMKRPPLGKRVDVIGRFARTRDPRALDLLLRRYRKPRIPKEFERYLIASAVGTLFSADSFAPARRAALEDYPSDEHAWLWYQLGRGAAARPQKVRAALLEAALWDARAARPDPADLDAIASLSEPPELVVRAAAAVLLAHEQRLGTPEFARAALPVIAQLSNEKFPEESRLVVARHLAAIFRVERATTHPLYWRQLLSYAGSGRKDGTTVEARPRFFGVEASGERLAFLIDLSDSMLEPLTPQERMDAERLEGAALDGEKIRTRFDLAKFVLARYLRSLPDSVSFAVVGFGDEALPLRSSRKFLPARRGNVLRALGEIEKIRPWGTDALHPHGQLRGATNIHGAFRKAYAIAGGRSLDEPVFIEETGWRKGCDTIFLLSDGRPTADDFHENDVFKGGKVTVNSETGETRDSAAGSANFRGPYARSNYLADDVERMNLFRKAEIHAIAMGSADPVLMRRLAKAGLGRYRSMGARAREGRLLFWQVVGPFDTTGPDQWTKAVGPEGAPFDARDMFGKTRWEPREAGHRNGVLSMNDLREPNSVVFAHARFTPDRPGPARLAAGADGGVRVWLNGKLVVDSLAPAEFKRDAHTVDVTLREGVNVILVKSCIEKGRRRINVRITGTPIKEEPYR